MWGFRLQVLICNPNLLCIAAQLLPACSPSELFCNFVISLYILHFSPVVRICSDLMVKPSSWWEVECFNETPQMRIIHLIAASYKKLPSTRNCRALNSRKTFIPTTFGQTFWNRKSLLAPLSLMDFARARSFPEVSVCFGEKMANPWGKKPQNQSKRQCKEAKFKIQTEQDKEGRRVKRGKAQEKTNLVLVSVAAPGAQTETSTKYVPTKPRSWQWCQYCLWTVRGSLF